jgi:hypothetical protein
MQGLIDPDVRGIMGAGVARTSAYRGAAFVDAESASSEFQVKRSLPDILE